ncbi:uncharacterized protein LOC113798122 [Dermatophagoides pteronyssinus]|uniref:Uncharacterized protein LOC113798122 n=2 Tax=Dermatophagoides pteronyssinus TaxID=6956 RepID=A0A6P6YH09_DERPT|nr:uncharacterized protein LOC113798122 [Dermatophagoides pteronyssinus]XP_027204522.1 uncharacterized protein LOC113798122 [Dermatophagoides pteronyssinus]KAH9418101.1 hypothetical protein DERP_014063 [Dermatophagoides pteronyssinus]KAH9418118.1 hypothetical protein DERP_014080 [Dermatophagoides pteronyssinus]
MNSSLSIDRDLLKKTISEQQSNKHQNRLYPFWPNDSDQFKRLSLIWKISSDYDLKQTWAIRHEYKYYFALNTITNITIGQQIRRFFGLNRQNLAWFSTITPSLAFSTILGTAIHFAFITSPIIDKPNDNHYKYLIRSTFTQLTTSVIYPIVFITGSSLYFAAKYLTQPIPDDFGIRPESRKYVWDKFLKQLFLKHRRSWSIFAIINVIAASTLTIMESEQTKQLFRNEQRKYLETQIEQ